MTLKSAYKALIHVFFDVPNSSFGDHKIGNTVGSLYMVSISDTITTLLENTISRFPECQFDCNRHPPAVRSERSIRAWHQGWSRPRSTHDMVVSPHHLTRFGHYFAISALYRRFSLNSCSPNEDFRRSNKHSGTNFMLPKRRFWTVENVWVRAFVSTFHTHKYSIWAKSDENCLQKVLPTYFSTFQNLRLGSINFQSTLQMNVAQIEYSRM